VHTRTSPSALDRELARPDERAVGIFNGEPVAKNGAIDLRDDLPGLGLTVNEAALSKFTVIE